MTIRQAGAEEAERVVDLYRMVIGQPYCTWNDRYPGIGEVNHDIETNNLFVCEEGDSLIGAISIVPENELDDVMNWAVSQNACEIARVVIKPGCQGKGYSRLLVQEIIRILQTERHCATIHLAVATVNVPAYRTYMSLGFKPVGEVDLYGHHFCLCEKVLMPMGK